jgi:hypothetical protein
MSIVSCPDCKGVGRVVEPTAKSKPSPDDTAIEDPDETPVEPVRVEGYPHDDPR